MNDYTPSGLLHSIFRSECSRLRLELCSCCMIKFRRRRCAGCDRYTDLQEECLLTGRRTDAKRSHLLGGRIVKLMRRICWDVDGLASVYHLFRATKSHVEFACKHGDSLFEVVTVRGGPPPGGMCMSVRQNRPAVSLAVSRIVSVSPTTPMCESFWSVSGRAIASLRCGLSGGIAETDCCGEFAFSAIRRSLPIVLQTLDRFVSLRRTRRGQIRRR